MTTTSLPSEIRRKLGPRARLSLALSDGYVRMMQSGTVTMIRPKTARLRKEIARREGRTREDRCMIYSWLLHRRHESRRKRHG